MKLKSKRFAVPFAAGLLVGVILTLAAGASTPSPRRFVPAAPTTLDIKVEAPKAPQATKTPEVDRNDVQPERTDRDHPELNLQLG